MAKERIHPKWYLCGVLVLIGLMALFVLRGYQVSGLAFLGLAAVIPTYHVLGILKNHRPKIGKALSRILTVFLCVMVIAMAVTCGIIADSSRGTDSPESKYLVVLGAKVNGTVPSRSLRERLDAAYDYLTTHPDAVAIVSGGQGNGEHISEAQCMFDYLVNAGIEPYRVWMEDQATSTLENLKFSLDVIEEKAGERPAQIAIVSSEYHLYRAKMFAGWLEIDGEMVPAKTEILPLRWNYFLREIFAVWYYSLFGGIN